ncbi:MAG: ZIP family metal transporter [Rubrivivax sp.]|nr:ZIP family metal transporter [Rubrivivax sp.]
MPEHPSLPPPSAPLASASWPPRYWLGGLIWLCGALAALYWLWRELVAGNPPVELALIGGSIAALATALGTLPALFNAGNGERTRDAMLGFGAGVMLAAASFSLVVPALASLRAQGQGPFAASLQVGLAVLAGAVLLLLIERMVQARLDQGQHRAASEGRRRAAVWLFVLAVMLHNVPEGLAIGVGFAGDLQAGRALATGIAIQDVPEGLVIAMALRGIGQSRLAAVGVGALSGLAEPVAAVLGALIVGTSSLLLAPGLGFAAGAMLFVIGHSVLPEAHRGGRAGLAAGALVVGFVLMMVLDTALA